MKIDFHYACVRALAEEAGFTPQDGQIVAYASQYVDDSDVEHPFSIEGVGGPAQSLVDRDGCFCPIETAHGNMDYFLEGLKDLADPRLQRLLGSEAREVYVAFHFIPPKPCSAGGFSWKVALDGPWANQLMQAASLDVRTAQSRHREAQIQALIRLGIATHSYADTWSHREFSGLKDPENNDVQYVMVEEGSRFVPHGNKLIRLPLGHWLADDYPDLTYKIWSYQIGGRTIYRDNPGKFLDAARRIHGYFAEITGAPRRAWGDIEKTVRGCLRQVSDRTWSAWRSAFPRISFSYDSKRWGTEALANRVSDSPPRYAFNVEHPYWYLFHFEADRQRREVLSGLPPVS